MRFPSASQLATEQMSSETASSSDNHICRPLWSEQQAAAYLGWSPKTLRNQRVRGGSAAVPYLKIGASVRYKPEDVIDFVASCRRSSTSD